jgi:PD-(D/E)XK nuclease superfamily
MMLPLPSHMPSMIRHDGLQTALNSSSLKPFKQCPRRYYYEVLWGWRTPDERVDLQFGELVHQGVQQYHHARGRGWDHNEALGLVVEWALSATWNDSLDKPIHLDHKTKTREGLIRSLVWYLDQYQSDTLQTTHDNAVEMRLESPLRSITGQQFLLFGTLDRLCSSEGSERVWIADIKTTDHEITKGFYFTRYTPDNQFSFYPTILSIAMPELECEGVVCDAIQIGSDWTRLQRGFIHRSREQLAEWQQDLKSTWLPAMEDCASRQYWPQNDTACGLWGGCPFRAVCSASPKIRESLLEDKFIRPKRSEEGKEQRNATATTL